ncbi:melatonin receptor type 1A-like [Hemitrygon akajei]|uniref:melatonin receptor type 1A-like n=1 Tax=Hemitrygon akajei TaxID=2704970 RepID=UPI003BF9FC37
MSGVITLSKNLSLEDVERLPERRVWVTSALATVLIFTIVVDLLGNSLVIVSILKNKNLRKVGNAFVISLAIADLLVAIYPYPLILIAIFRNGWVHGHTHCQMSGLLMGLSVIGSIFNITAIAINRYCYICHGLNYNRIFSHRKTFCYVSLVWMLTSLAVIPNLFVGSLQYDPRIYSCTFVQSVSPSYTVTIVAIHFILPISIVSYCYLRIWIYVVRVRKRVKPENQSRIIHHDFRNFLTMFVVFVLFAICWAPLNFIGLGVAVNPNLANMIPEWLFIASYFMAYFNSSLNAIVYGVLNHKFRQEYKQIMIEIINLNKQIIFLRDTSRFLVIKG